MHKCIFCQGDVPETEPCQQQYQPILSKVLPPPQEDDNFSGRALTCNNDDRKYYSSLSLADLLLLLVYIPLDIFRHYSFFRSKKNSKNALVFHHFFRQLDTTLYATVSVCKVYHHILAEDVK